MQTEQEEFERALHALMKKASLTQREKNELLVILKVSKISKRRIQNIQEEDQRKELVHK
jgi:hypothetical protein